MILKILGNTFVVSNINSTFQNVLTELNTTNGNLENIKRYIDANNHSYTYMAEKNGYLYIFISFKGNMSFPNGTITSTTYYDNGNYLPKVINWDI